MEPPPFLTTQQANHLTENVSGAHAKKTAQHLLKLTAYSRSKEVSTAKPVTAQFYDRQFDTPE
jgi:hypothetical protein